MKGRNGPGCRIGLALGSGSSRGWAHIGIIRALSELGIEPDIVCGCSIGALVGASHAADNLDRLEGWVCSLRRLEFAKFLELNTSFRGFVNTKRFRAFLRTHVCKEDLGIEELGRVFASVSTDLETGREIWFTKGPVIEAVWSSLSLPGIFPPIQNQGRWLVDGGLVNPVPVSLCRALGADIVIAVNLNGDIVGKHFERRSRESGEEGMVGVITKIVREYSTSPPQARKQKNKTPGLFDAIAGSINIMQDRITRSRMAGDPPDVLLVPKLGHIGLLEFYRGKEAIEEGKQCVARMLPEIQHVVGTA